MPINWPSLSFPPINLWSAQDMSILEKIKQHKAKRNNTHEAVDTMDKLVFERALIDLGIDRDTINDCLEESPVLWPNFLSYFDGKYGNDK